MCNQFKTDLLPVQGIKAHMYTFFKNTFIMQRTINESKPIGNIKCFFVTSLLN